MDTPVTGEHAAELTRFARAVASICALPGAATMDWCDRAAGAIASLFHEAFALVVIGAVDGTGRIVSREAIGAAAGTDKGAIEDLRARVFHLASVPVAMPAASHERTSCHISTEHDAMWGTSPCVRLWNGLGARQVLILTAKLGIDQGRVLHAQIALRQPCDEMPCRATMAIVAVSALAHHAERTIGVSASDGQHWLSTREQEVLDQLITGRSIKQIAHALSRSPHTVHDHVKSLHRKLGARTRGELVARALGFLPHARDNHHAGNNGASTSMRARRMNGIVPRPT